MSRLRIMIPDDWTEVETFDGLVAAAAGLMGEPLQKALKNPLPGIEKANARRSFLRLQDAYREHVQEVVASLDDVARTVADVKKTHAVPPAAQAQLTGLLDRMHLRTTAQLRTSFNITYERAFELGLRGAGAARGIMRNEELMVADLIENEAAYAKNFSTDVAWREGRLAYDQRADLYGNALEELYWLGYVYGDLSRGRYIRWAMAPAAEGGNNWGKHKPCIDCSWISGNLRVLEEYFQIDPQVAKAQGAGGRWGNGVYLAQELAQMAVVPKSGKLTCTTRCRCKLQPSRKPLSAPRHRKFLPWQSQLPKSFTGTVKTENGELVMDREHKITRRKRYAKTAEATEHKHRPRN